MLGYNAGGTFFCCHHYSGTLYALQENTDILRFMTHEDQIIQAVKKVMPAVVSISAAKDIKLPQEEIPFLPRAGSAPGDVKVPPEEPMEEIKIGGGSGFIVDSAGLILTNRHVIVDPDAEYTAIMNNDEKHRVVIAARDPIHDIAILKIQSETPLPPLPVVEMCEDEALELGQTVIAIGNALGEFQNSVSTGVVSGLSRLVSAITDVSGHQERLRGLIQTDAAINPGNSGGPLVNMKGQAIGINAAIVYGAQNIGFAIPIHKAARDLDDIRKYGHIKRPFLGIRYLLLNEEISKRFKLPASAGALILKEAIPGDHAIVPGSAAEKAGLAEGDIVLKFNGVPISEKKSLEDILETVTVGQTIVAEFLRNGTEKRTTSVTLLER